MSGSYLAYGLGLLGGVVLSIQPTLNAQVAQKLGQPIYGGLVNFLSGSILLLCIAVAVALRTAPPTAKAAAEVPVYLWFAGGTIGAYFVTASLWGAPKIGVGAWFALVIAGQLTMSVIIDHFGLFGIAERPTSLWRLIGVALLFSGAVLVTTK